MHDKIDNPSKNTPPGTDYAPEGVFSLFFKTYFYKFIFLFSSPEKLYDSFTIGTQIIYNGLRLMDYYLFS